MKAWGNIWIASWAVWLVCASGFADAQYHDFMDTQGRTVRGRVLRYDALSMQVTIETDNRRTATVPVTVFDDEGQAYINEWAKAQDFMDENSLKIEVSRKENDDDSESYDTLNMDMDVENHSYEIELKNRSTTPLNNLKLEYCIYYEQDEVVKHKQTTDQGVLCGTLDVPDMRPKSEQTLMTEGVTIYKKTLDADWMYYADIKNVQKGDVDGIWIRITMTTDTGKEFVRDYCLPDSLNNKRTWTTTSTYVGMNKEPRRKNKKKK